MFAALAAVIALGISLVEAAPPGKQLPASISKSPSNVGKDKRNSSENANCTKKKSSRSTKFSYIKSKRR